jgi:N-acetylglucosaminyl-diphospho-decaprenol L-rhamnosyltransferase
VNAPRVQQTPGLADVRPRLTVIIVNYNGWPDVLRLVSALEAEPAFGSGELQIVVVDNASAGPVPEQLRQSPPSGLRLLERPDNGGFAVGVNAGWRLARSAWLLVLNPDVEISRGLIGQVIERIGRYDSQPSGPPGIVGFALRNCDGSTQGSVGVFPSLLRTMTEQFIPRARRKYQVGWRIRSGPVDWVTGACMLVNSRMMAELGGMDEDFFLYHEEVAFSRSAQDRGWRVEYDAGVNVIHRHPLQNRAISPKMRVITRHSKLLYFRKHLPRWQFLGLSWIVTVESLARGLGAWALGRVEEDRAWKTIHGVARRLRDGADVRGQDVLELAEALETGQPARSRPGVRPHRGLDRAAAVDPREPVPTSPPAARDDRPA